MTERQNNLGNFFEDMVRKGLVTTSNNWIERAVEQKNPRLSVSIAASKILVYDALDCQLLNRVMNN